MGKGDRRAAKPKGSGKRAGAPGGKGEAKDYGKIRNKVRAEEELKHGSSKKQRVYKADFYEKLVGNKDRKKVLTFNPDELSDFVSGFKKRKDQRRVEAREKNLQKAKQEKRMERKTKRLAWQKLESSVYGRPKAGEGGEDGSEKEGEEEDGSDGGSGSDNEPEEEVFDSATATVKVTTMPLSLEEDDDLLRDEGAQAAFGSEDEDGDEGGQGNAKPAAKPAARRRPKSTLSKKEIARNEALAKAKAAAAEQAEAEAAVIAEQLRQRVGGRKRKQLEKVEKKRMKKRRGKKADDDE